ncbi:MAG: fumarate hydratase, partial [Clostridiales bacterium]|nr:fumarate hydratase [Clostridiales bacterium]
MRELDVTKIRDAVAALVQEVNHSLSPDILCAISGAAGRERNDRAAYILGKIEENIRIAGEEHIPLCQDTGLACVFLEVGQEVAFTGGYLYDAINEGVRRGYTDGYLRKSVVADPLQRVNTGDNTPAHIHVDIVPGDRVRLMVAPKGFGSENMSRIKMFPPSAGEEGVKEFI